MHTNEGAKHPYAVATDREGNIYATFQHTDVALRFQKDVFTPLGAPAPAPSSHAAGGLDASGHKLFSGTFYQFGEPTEHDLGEQGVRGIAIVESSAWIANEDLDVVTVVDTRSGETVRRLDVKRPINIYFCRESGLVFVGSKSSKKKGTCTLYHTSLTVHIQYIQLPPWPDILITN